MRKKYLFYGIIIMLVSVGIFIGALNLRSAEKVADSPQSSPSVPAEATTPTAPAVEAEDPCSCCAERKGRLEQKIQEARARRAAKQRAEADALSD